MAESAAAAVTTPPRTAFFYGISRPSAHSSHVLLGAGVFERSAGSAAASGCAVIEVIFKRSAQQQQQRRLRELKTTRHIALTGWLSRWPQCPLSSRRVGTVLAKL